MPETDETAVPGSNAPNRSPTTPLGSALETGAVVISLLLVVVGGGLTGDPAVLMTIAVGISLSLMFAALLARWWKPRRPPTA